MSSVIRQCMQCCLDGGAVLARLLAPCLVMHTSIAVIAMYRITIGSAFRLVSKPAFQILTIIELYLLSLFPQSIFSCTKSLCMY